ncbi:amino acid adenylation domain-containing protein [Vallitalea pronyensis]|uniref:Amino acid adenylation domain-containing protein n=1 Tax=Vallitalea pronyensis TaxID=1348613 RepID=A0A8J8MHN5_9FIRM|nr:non-ribosomal peptide synthetase [Vallitalea pronyensis]QUI21830.1 amino acid adenylation domain-containing protein [Vallitalea pronyensis]
MNSIEANKHRLYPLTHPQKRIWYLEKIYPNTSLHNIGGTVCIHGKINFQLLHKAIHIFIQKNEGLRLKLIEKDGKVEQYIDDMEDYVWDFMDFSHSKDSLTAFNKWIQLEAGKPFELKNTRLFYFAFFKISENKGGYFVKFHHIIADGWSMMIMTNHIYDAYMKLIHTEPISHEVAYTYLDYIRKENQYFSTSRFMKNRLFWNKRFNVLPDTSLYTSSDTITGQRKTYTLDKNITTKIKDFTQKNGVSYNTLFATLYLIYLYKITGKKDLVIGIPVFNRSGKKEKKTFGMFTSTMPFRFVIDNNHSFYQVIAKANEELMACYYNQKYPYDLLLQDLELKKRGYDNLFNTCINYYNTKLQLEWNGCPIENVEFYNGNQVYSLQLIIREWTDSECLTLDFDYKTKDYTEKEIDTLYARLYDLLNQLFLKPHDAVSRHSMMPTSTKEKLLYAFNTTTRNYPKDKTIHQLFEEQVQKTPQNIAIIFQDNQLTYQLLNHKSNQLARYLLKKGVKKETIIGLLTTHSIESVIGILGILKAGGAYLPIDPTYPIERISYMLKDADSQILLTNTTRLSEDYYEGTIIDISNDHIYNEDTSNIESMSKSNQLAYVIYTSGSTGKPKGTMIEHQALLNYVWWTKRMYVSNEAEIFPLYSTLAFDLTVTSIFTPLITGNKIIVYKGNSNDNVHVLYRILKDNQATIMKLTPSHLSLLHNMELQHSSLRKFIVGGEALKVSLAKNIYESYNGNIEIWNEYGPTETVVGCMIHKYNDEKDTYSSVPIGRPIDNVQVYILDDNLHPVLEGEIGELYVSGDGVARGYINNTLLTRERFIQNPYVKHSRMYKTGDLARFIEGGHIEYVGRMDQQVKIRGHRVELGEIERYLETHMGVQEAVVHCMEDNNTKYLCAYIVIKNKTTMTQLKSFLREGLPDYMMPLYFIELDHIPLTHNGKVNKTLLPNPVVNDLVHVEHVAYRTKKEEILSHAIRKVLNMKELSIKQNFYHIGGDSIKAIQIASILNDKGYTIKVKDILSYPMIEDMALCIKKNNMFIDQKPSEGRIQHTPIISWFFEQKLKNSNHYVQSILLELKQDVDSKQVEMMFNKIVYHHDALRINVDATTKALFYNHQYLEQHHHLQVYDLVGLSTNEQRNYMIRVAEDLKMSFNIYKGILIKACMFKRGQHSGRLLIMAHHLVIDGVSWRIIIDDMNRMMEQIQKNQKTVLPSKTQSYQSWAKRLEEYGQTVTYEEIKYWHTVRGKHVSVQWVNDSEYIEDNMGTLSAQLSVEDTTCLLFQTKKAYNTTPKELLITALVRTIKHVTKHEDIVIELEGHGREDIFDNINVTRTVGWFTSLYPFYIRLKSDDLPKQIKHVKEKVRAIPNKGMGFGVLQYITKHLKEDPKEVIRFNFMGSFMEESMGTHVELVSNQFHWGSRHTNPLTCLMDITCYMIRDKLDIVFSYNRHKIKDRVMGEFVSQYKANIETIIAHCCTRKVIEFTPSDFDTVELSQDELDNMFT